MVLGPGFLQPGREVVREGIPLAIGLAAALIGYSWARD
jgi:hypothetical protein